MCNKQGGKEERKEERKKRGQTDRHNKIRKLGKELQQLNEKQKNIVVLGAAKIKTKGAKCS